jgi:hypothetical protein
MLLLLLTLQLEHVLNLCLQLRLLLCLVCLVVRLICGANAKAGTTRMQ